MDQDQQRDALEEAANARLGREEEEWPDVYAVRKLSMGMVSMYLSMIADIDPSSPGYQHGDKAADEAVYAERNTAIVMAVGFALQAGMPAGFRIDQHEPEWPVAYIELPTGQVAWHLKQYAKPYDGHSTETKYERIREFVQHADSAVAAML